VKTSRLGSRVAFLAVALASLSLGAGSAAAGSARQSAGLTVYAAASLTDVLPAIEPSATYSFAGSNTLAAQIQNGAPADVFASANTAIPQLLYEQGLVEKPVVFTRNTLVVVVPKSNPANIHSIYDLVSPGVKIDVAAPGVPVGNYTIQVLGQMGLAAKLDPNIVSEDTDVRAVLAKVQTGQADAGFVYATDAQSAAGQVSVIKVPAWAQPKVAYSMAVVARSPNQLAATAFVAQVLSRSGQAIMSRYGFLPATAPVPTISSVKPRRVRAGAKVTLTGANFAGTTSVTFRGISAEFRIVSASKLTVVVPRRARTGWLTVTNPAGSATSVRLVVLRK
jgi:molybdate transport system substrate-binding protein